MNARTESPYRILPDPNRAPRRKMDTATNWDRFLQIHPAVPAAVYLTPSAWFLWRSYLAPGPVGSTWVLFASGLAVWTVLEYVIHRGLLHPADIGAWWNMGLAEIHGSHHEHPEDVSQVVLSVARTAPLALILYGALRLAFHAVTAGAVLAGILSGYVAYEFFHYLYHAPVSIRLGWLQELRKYHALHHFSTPDRRFGVTVPVWDKVFGTGG